MSEIIQKFQNDLQREPAAASDLKSFYEQNGGLPTEEPAKVQMPEAQLLQQMTPKAPAQQGATGSDVGGMVGDVAKGVAKGGADIVRNIWNAGVDVLEGMDSMAAKMGVGKGDLISDNAKVQFQSIAEKPTDPTAEKVARGITKYGAPVAATMGLGGGVLAGLAVGAGIDIATLDPKQERLSSIVRDEFPSLRGTAVVGASLDYLADTKGSDLENRFKNALEGIGVGAAAATVLRGAQKLGKFVGEYMGASKAARIPTLEEQASRVATDVTMSDKAVQGEATLSTAAPAPSLDAPPVIDTEKTFFDPKMARTLDDGSIAPNLHSGDLMTYLKEFAAANPTQPWERTAKGSTDEAVKGFFGEQKNIDELLNWAKQPIENRRPLSEVEVTATKYLLNNSASSVLDAAKKVVTSGAAEDHALLAESLNSFGFMDEIRRGAGSEAGAAFNAHKIAQDTSGMRLSEYSKLLKEEGQRKFLSDLVNTSGGRDKLDQIAKQLIAISDRPGGVDEILSKAAKLTEGKTIGAEQMIEHLVTQSMLSSPHTAVKNFIANAFTTANSVATSYGSVLTSSLLKDPEAAVTLAQANAYTKGLMTGFFSHVSAAGNKLAGRTVEDAAEVSKDMLKLEYRTNPISSSNMGLSPESLLGKTVDKIGWVSSLPGKMNGTADKFFGSMMYQAKLAELGHLEAQKIVVAGDSAKGLAEGRSAFLENFMKDPPVEAHFAAKDHAQYNTFSNALEKGSFAEWVDQGLEDKIPYGRVLFPFFKTNANIIAYTYQHSPFKALAASVAPSVRADMFKEGAEGAVAMAKIMNGTMFLGAMTYLAHEGIITGPEPRNYQIKTALQEANKGWQPDSLHVNGNYVNISGIDQVASFARLGSIMAQAHNYMSQEEYGQFAVLAGGAVADFLTPEQMVGNTTNMFDAWSEASKYGANTATKVGSVATDILMRGVPAISKDIKNLVDPIKGSAMGSNQGGLDGAITKITSMLAARVPYFSENLPIDRNFFGEPIMVPSAIPRNSEDPSSDSAFTKAVNFISPFAVTHGEASPLNDALLKLGQYYNQQKPLDPELQPLVVTMPPKVFTEPKTGVKLQLTDKEYERLIMYQNGVDPDTGGKLSGLNKKMLEDIIMPIYKDGQSNEMNTKQYNMVVGKMSQVILKMKEQGHDFMVLDPVFGPRLQKAREEQLNKPDTNLFQ